MINFFAIFSFSYIVVLNIGLFVYIFRQRKKTKQAIKDLNFMLGGLRNENKEDC